MTTEMQSGMERFFDQEYSVLRQKSLSDIYAEIAEVYLSNNFPWVIGFSGGKDSTATVQLIWYALKRLPKEQRTKHVYVVSSDTLVESPPIVERINRSLRNINEAAKRDGLPLSAHKVSPEIEESFWVNLLGRGYPAPYRSFRWCTDRMKIKPTNKFVMDKVSEFGEVVVALGVRKAESFTREQVINLHKITGSRLSRHSMLPGAYVYTPIEEFTVKDVWDYLFLEENPWGENNMDLRELYESADGECPMVIDTLTPSCGNTRFGCWVCTVVEKDRSMEAMVNSGGDWMTPLLEFRNFLADTQDTSKKSEIRQLVRRNGQVMVQEKERTEGGATFAYKKVIYGPFTFKFRQELLRRLLQTQREVRERKGDPDFKLIQDNELFAIRRIWLAEVPEWGDVLPKIYHEETGETLDWIQDDTSVFGVLEQEILEEICQKRGVPSGLVKQLITTEQSYFGMRRRHQIFQKIENLLKRDWRSEEEILAYLASEKVVNHPVQLSMPSEEVA